MQDHESLARLCGALILQQVGGSVAKPEGPNIEAGRAERGGGVSDRKQLAPFRQLGAGERCTFSHWDLG